MKPDRIGMSCIIAIDSINAARDYLSQAIANLRYASQHNTKTESEHIRSNALSSAHIDLDRASERINTLKEYVEALRQQHWDEVMLLSAPIPEVFPEPFAVPAPMEMEMEEEA